MNVSVIIPTFNGAQKLPALLEALMVQSKTDFELIIVNDGSTDGTPEVLNLYRKKFTSLKIINQENLGRARVRNTGAQQASGAVLIFYDDDMVPQSNSIERHLQFHFDYTGLCTGSQRERLHAANTDIQNYKAHLSQKWLSQYSENLNKLSVENLFFTAANCSIKTEVFQTLGGFNENLRDGEDFELAFRAIKAGIPVYFDKGNEAWHEEQYSLNKLISRQKQYNTAHVILGEIHPELHKAQSKFYRNKWAPLKKATALILHSLGFTKILPRMLRYKLYDWMIFTKL